MSRFCPVSCLLAALMVSSMFAQSPRVNSATSSPTIRGGLVTERATANEIPLTYLEVMMLLAPVVEYGTRTVGKAPVGMSWGIPGETTINRTILRTPAWRHIRHARWIFDEVSLNREVRALHVVYPDGKEQLFYYAETFHGLHGWLDVTFEHEARKFLKNPLEFIDRC